MWFYQSPKDVVGPLTSAELIEKIRKGDVVEGTLVRKGESAWSPAEQVNGLLEAATKDHVFHCPYCGKKIGRPPATCRACDRSSEMTEDQFQIARQDGTTLAPPENAKPKQPKTKFGKWLRSLMDDE